MISWIEVITRARGTGKTKLVVDAANNHDGPVILVACSKQEVQRLKSLVNDPYRVKVVGPHDAERVIGTRAAPVLFDPDAVANMLIEKERTIDKLYADNMALRKELMSK